MGADRDRDKEKERRQSPRGRAAPGARVTGRQPARADAGARPRRDRLDQPQLRKQRMVRMPSLDSDAFGRLSERFARFMGTGRFIVWMTIVILVWVIWNVTVPASWRFDQYPFIFLTLALSLQASYAAPLILLAQNRQDDRDRVGMEQDRDRAARNIADTEFLVREVAALRQGLGEVATRDFLRSELQTLTKELEQRGELDGLAETSAE